MDVRVRLSDDGLANGITEITDGKMDDCYAYVCTYLEKNEEKKKKREKREGRAEIIETSQNKKDEKKLNEDKVLREKS